MNIEIPLPVVVLGTIIGMTYGLLAVGLVLIYRSNRIVNFAHGEIGAFAAAVFGVVVIRWHVPYYVALPLAMALGGAVAALAEVAVVRRLRNAPRLMSIVATLGIGQFLVFFGAAVNNQASAGFIFPQPPFVPVFQIGALRITPAYSGILFIAPWLVVAIAVFLRRSSFGIGIRAAAANAEAARMAGIFAGRMSSLAWALAGAASAFTAILVQPSRGFTSGESFGPSLLLRALAGAVIARMVSLPVALAAGIGLGIVEQLLLWNHPRAGFVELALFAIILGALLLQRPQGGRDEEKGSWAAVQAWRPVPDAFRSVFLVRHLGVITGVVAAAASVVLIMLVTNSDAIILVSMMGFAVVGLSVGVITGLGGQLSLGQFALGAVGATISYYVSSRTGSFPLAFLYAGLGAAAMSLLIGLPALRLKGLMLTVTTLSFALVTPAWLLQQEWMLGSGVDPGRPIVFGNALDTGREYYGVALVVTVLMVILARNVRRGGFGRLLVAIRDNEDNARAFTVPARLVKVQGFLLAGFIAGVGGAMYGHAFSRIGSTVFGTRASIDVVVMTVIGGISTLAGPLIGVLYTIGVPAFVPLDAAGLAATSLGFLLLVMYLPGGLAQVILPVRDRIVARLVRGRVDLEAGEDGEPGDDAAMPVARRLAARDRSTPASAEAHRVLRPKLLEAVDLVKHFGGVRAVDGVSLHVRTGETLGLIGPNGAGKTTTFELLGGFTRPDRGAVRFDGRDVTRLGPEARARLGLIRSFQDAALFPTMTVEETVMLALERVMPTSFLRSCAGVTAGDREKRRRAAELVELMGLGRYRGAQIQELSTGTRRITELACLVAVEPTLLLLDEPSSGIAQRETEALGALLADLKRELSLTLVVIEHDIPLVMSLADRMVVMDAGSVIAAGPPEIVRTDARVVEAYLGGSIEAIERSGTATPSRAPRAKEPA
ncbi:MAG TPA: branched-chain amino acid ABC transporter permease/ATP-binding protein [Acidimicrobiales bacterium]|nr:branched-chain amino acid ABC transporter permease/ATP-binding protein [Acidimicrobiales bacterium]